MDQYEIQSKLLDVLSNPVFRDSRLGKGQHYLIENLNDYLQDQGIDDRVSNYEFMIAVWALVSQGLAFIDFSQPASENWSLALTCAGREAAGDSKYTPNNVPGYLKKITDDLPGLDEKSRLYLNESLRAYSSGTYIASTIMIGVSVESLFLDAARAFAIWAPDNTGKNLLEKLDKESLAYIQKFEEFRKRLPSHIDKLPDELRQNLDLNLNSILELFRIVRNSAGHPTGVKVTKEQAFQYLVLYPMLAKKLLLLRDYCTN